MWSGSSPSVASFTADAMLSLHFCWSFRHSVLFRVVYVYWVHAPFQSHTNFQTYMLPWAWVCSRRSSWITFFIRSFIHSQREICIAGRFVLPYCLVPLMCIALWHISIKRWWYATSRGTCALGKVNVVRKCASCLLLRIPVCIYEPYAHKYLPRYM